MATDLSPSAPNNYSVMGKIYDKLGIYDKAIESYERALKLGDDDPTTSVQLGFVLQKVGRLAEAIARFQKAREQLIDADNLVNILDGAISECRTQMGR